MQNPSSIPAVTDLVSRVFTQYGPTLKAYIMPGKGYIVASTSSELIMKARRDFIEALLEDGWNYPKNRFEDGGVVLGKVLGAQRVEFVVSSAGSGMFAGRSSYTVEVECRSQPVPLETLVAIAAE